MSSSLLRRYRGLPPWVLLAQLFLAAGWQRAAAAHSLDAHWWDGIEITQFVAGHNETSIDWFRSTVLAGPVDQWPVAIAVVVFAGQVIVAAMLALNVRPLWALAIGAGLNISFVLGGAVNPSVFYLIIGAALALWHVEASVGATNARRLTAASTLVGAAALGALIPEVATVDPAQVIDDPAMVLSFVILLWVAALQINMGRVTIPGLRPTPAGPDDHSSVHAKRAPSGGLTPPAGTADAGCHRLQRSR